MHKAKRSIYYYHLHAFSTRTDHHLILLENFKLTSKKGDAVFAHHASMHFFHLNYVTVVHNISCNTVAEMI